MPVVPLQPRKPQRLEPVAELLDVEREVLHPERRPLADGGELRRLEVGVGEAGQPRACGWRSVSSAAEHRDEPAEQQAQAVAHDDQIGVVGDERAGGAEVQERPGGRGLVAEGVHVRHDVVAEAPLVARRRGEVGVVEVGPHLRQRLLGDRRGRAPARPRRARARAGARARCGAARPRALHRGRGVAGAERRASSGRRSSEHQVGEGDLALALEVDPDDLARANVRGGSPTCEASRTGVRLMARITSPSRSPVAAAHLRRDPEDERALARSGCRARPGSRASP